MRDLALKYIFENFSDVVFERFPEFQQCKELKEIKWALYHQEFERMSEPLLRERAHHLVNNLDDTLLFKLVLKTEAYLAR